jgi:RNA polymerase sigma factor (sigma-70 family)
MFNVSMRIMQNREEAEDILQDAFVDVFTKLESFRGDSTFGAWFKRIVINKSLNAIKKKKVLTTELENVAEATEDEEVQEESQFNYTVDQVRSAVELLPEGYRIVFTLFMFEGYSHKQIAAELDVTESTSKSQYNRAKKKIRHLLTTKITSNGR